MNSENMAEFSEIDDSGAYSKEEQCASFAEEVDFDVTQMYFHEISGKPLLTREQEMDLARLAKRGDAGARRKMIEHNLRLVVNIARHYVNRGIDFMDLVEEGNLGLMHALDKFEPEKGFRFSTYATWWIRQNVERAIMNHSRTIRLPVYVVREINAIRRMMRTVDEHLGANERSRAVSGLLNVPVERVWATLQKDDWMVSLDAPIDADPDLSVGDAIADEQCLPADEILEGVEMSALMAALIERLNPKERAVIEMRFGVGCEETMTLEQVAQSMGLTRERIRQIQNDALHHLRKYFEDQAINADMANLH